MTRRNHRIAIKTCQNFKHSHFARLVHCCDGVLKDYRLMSIDIVTSKDTKLTNGLTVMVMYQVKK